MSFMPRNGPAHFIVHHASFSSQLSTGIDGKGAVSHDFIPLVEAGQNHVGISQRWPNFYFPEQERRRLRIRLLHIDDGSFPGPKNS
ncbi:hypothetical protein SDC9_180575 [bioreactor metagenome]|uniref:Uncharacterized protein n=1 Tax=bioreactor metagenome TaxID=1076179 RepID=A0A645H440_9ZZZZ